MFWQEDEDHTETHVPDDIVDLLFAIECRSIPVDHVHALSQALQQVAPRLGEGDVGMHSIHVAGSQNGWERPGHGSGQQLQLSRRTKLCLRVPKQSVNELQAALEGQTLDVAGSSLHIGHGKLRPLSREGTLFARYVAGPVGVDEDGFLRWAADELGKLGIRVRKALCGKTTCLDTPDGPLATHSLMLADLSQDESILLQQRGLGPYRHMGCGIFIAHKGVDAVHKTK